MKFSTYKGSRDFFCKLTLEKTARATLPLKCRDFKKKNQPREVFNVKRSNIERYNSGVS